MAAGVASEPRPGWGRTIVVSRPNQEHGPLLAAFNHAAGRGVATRYAGAVLADLDRYVERRVAETRTASLSHGLIVETIVAAYHAEWPARDASRLLLTLQAEMDGPSPPVAAHFRQSIDRVQAGGTVEEALGAQASRRAAR